ncbi:MAG: glycerophosphodiester phosphodiesterase family protein [Candidatus Hydrogenedentes bacterium]|nr:glycerophosphodiester phosphodiesterase family protein [Candidatus Hydrogenedentota bacterium]
MFWIIAYSLFAAPAPIDDELKLIAHRGGIVDEQHPENTPASLSAALEQRYWMLELDLRRTRDGVIILQHDRDFKRVYGSKAKAGETDWDAVARLTSLVGNQHPMTFKEAAERCRGHSYMMLDMQDDWPEEALREAGQILSDNGLLDSAIFIGAGASKAYFKGKARIATSLEGLRQAVASGEDAASLYCLFAHGNELDDEAVRYAASVHVPVVASVNTYHYLLKPNSAGPETDSRRLYSAGVRLFQIDSEYAPILAAFGSSPFPEVDKAQDWLWEHPTDGTNASARREHMAVIQAAADECPNDIAERFLLNLPEAASSMERYGILHGLQRASDHAFDDIRRTRVKSGLALWLLYNMGYVFKTPDACFAVDICLRDARRLAGVLDFLLITHPHPDHFTGGLGREMIARGKPVVSPFL